MNTDIDAVHDILAADNDSALYKAYLKHGMVDKANEVRERLIARISVPISLNGWSVTYKKPLPEVFKLLNRAQERKELAKRQPAYGPTKHGKWW